MSISFGYEREVELISIHLRDLHYEPVVIPYVHLQLSDLVHFRRQRQEDLGPLHLTRESPPNDEIAVILCPGLHVVLFPEIVPGNNVGTWCSGPPPHPTFFLVDLFLL
ncbi:hypothetical protein CDL15_Pgr004572 [Punica granatum]|uniref:Uncharacterized protein n=1 Tax=Punica granatum TaxID=22663 RepID=A0A218WPR4_PUNGR|nr:hypothetical protein CDL15_Pgr004572 [Punica granatum]